MTRSKSYTLVERLDADHRDRIVFVLEPPDRTATQKEFRARMWCLVQLRKLGYYKPPRRARKEKGRSCIANVNSPTWLFFHECCQQDGDPTEVTVSIIGSRCRR